VAPRHVLLLGGAVAAGVTFPFVEGLGAVDVVAGGCVGAALTAARRHTRVAWLVAAAALAVSAPDGVSFGVVALAAGIVFCAGRWEEGWAGAAALAALLGAAELGPLATGEAGMPTLLLMGAAYAAGRALGDRERVAAQLAQRVRELDEEREAHAALSVRYERARIASELHDVVAHALSVMVVQASAGQRLAGRDTQATAEAFEAIAEAARQAEEDMARLVALLGDEDAIAALPDLELVRELVQRAAGSGLDVTLRLEGDREGLPAPLVQAACRVVQEGLTNALRYAAGTGVRVLVDGGRDALTVEVRNAPAPGDATLAGVGTGTGIQGLRERVGAVGGTLQAGPAGDGGWLVRATLPRRPAPAHSRG